MSDSSPSPDPNRAAPKPAPSAVSRTRRWIERTSDRLGMRPLTVLVFVASIIALAMLQASSQFGTISGKAVATAPSVEHTSPVASTVIEVHVRPGEQVAAGTPLVTLSSEAVEAELRIVSAEIAALERAAEHDQLRLDLEHDAARRDLEQAAAEAARDSAVAASAATRDRAVARAAETQLETLEKRVEARIESSSVIPEATYRAATDEATARDARRAAGAESGRSAELAETLESWSEEPALSAASARLFAARIEVLRARQTHLRSRLEHAVIVARRDGIVTQIVAAGAPADPALSLATIVPTSATEIVAWLDPSVAPDTLVAGAEVHIVSPPGTCAGRVGRVLRHGSVAEAPGQVRSFLDNPVHGLPVYISVPDGCALGVGQLLEVEFSR